MNIGITVDMCTAQKQAEAIHMLVFFTDEPVSFNGDRILWKWVKNRLQAVLNSEMP